MTVLIVVGCVLVYLSVGTVVARFVAWVSDPSWFDRYDPFDYALVVVLWPLAFVLLVSFGLPILFMEHVGPILARLAGWKGRSRV